MNNLNFEIEVKLYKSGGIATDEDFRILGVAVDNLKDFLPSCEMYEDAEIALWEEMLKIVKAENLPALSPYLSVIVASAKE